MKETFNIDKLQVQLSANSELEQQLQQITEKTGRPVSLGEYYRLGLERGGILQDLRMFTGTLPRARQSGSVGRLDEILRAMGHVYARSGVFQMPEAHFIDDLLDIGILKQTRYAPEMKVVRQFFEIRYVLDGTCNQTVQGKTGTEHFEIRAGDLLILSPQTTYTSYVTGNSVVLSILIRETTFRSAFLHNIPGSTALSEFFTRILYSQLAANYVLFHTGFAGEVRAQMFSLLQTYCGGGLHQREILNLRLSLLFMLLLRDCSDDTTFSGAYSRDVDYILPILHYMETHYAETDVGDIAQHFNFSLSYLCRLFKKHTGTTMHDTLRRVRMQKAAILLTQTTQTVEEVGALVGYYDATSFIRRFRESFGTTPARYRKQGRNTEEDQPVISR